MSRAATLLAVVVFVVMTAAWFSWISDNVLNPKERLRDGRWKKDLWEHAAAVVVLIARVAIFPVVLWVLIAVARRLTAS